MDDLRQDSQTGLPTECFALCSEHFEASCFSGSVLIGTPVDFKRFYLEKGSVPSIYGKPITEEMREDLQINYFPITFFGRFFGTLPRNISIQSPPPFLPPPQKKTIVFGLGRPIRNMFSIFQDDRSTTLSNTISLF